MYNTDQALHLYLASFKLLCVDSNKMMQSIYKDVFEIVFLDVVIVSTAQEALAHCESTSVDIILTEYDLPDMNGLKLIEKIHEKNKNTPIVLVTQIEDVEVVVKALNMGVHSFVSKPFDIAELNESIESSAKIVIANSLLEKERNEKRLLEEERIYTQYQEELTFRKELAILRNDFYYQRHKFTRELLIDLHYAPLDTLSGDVYSARAIDDTKMLFFIADGMGKGLSASLSAMLFTAFMNHRLDMMLQTNSFDLETLIRRCINYMQKVILDDEILSAEFIVIDESKSLMQYAIFSMPSLMLEKHDGTVVRINSNNPPIDAYQISANIDTYDLSSVIKMLFVSDGLVENSVDDKSSYEKHIETDFINSFSRAEFTQAVYNKIKEPEDDITFIFLHYLDPSEVLITKTYQSNIENIQEAQAWFEEFLHSLDMPMKQLHGASLGFNELFMNAHEHGNLAIDNNTKQKLIATGEYENHLLEQEKLCDKTITVSIQKIEYKNGNTYVATTITDEGEGFDTQQLAQIFRNRKKYNGKGVFISRKSSEGIFYNTKGNSVLFISRIN